MYKLKYSITVSVSFWVYKCVCMPVLVNEGEGCAQSESEFINLSFNWILSIEKDIKLPSCVRNKMPLSHLTEKILVTQIT